MAHLIVGCLLLLSVTSAAAREIIADPGNYRQALKTLAAGDTLRLQPGHYLDGLPLHRLLGQAEQRIVITGPSAGDPAVFLARSGQNTVSLLDSSHLTLRHLTLDGRHLPVDAVKAEGHGNWTHHITLEHLRILNHGNNQQTVGISTKSPAWGWEIRYNEIIGAGTGIYLGNSDGRAPFIAGLIEHNLIVDSLGYNLQIKHQRPRDAIPGMPTGEQQTTIRHNVFSKAHGGNSKDMARPNVLVGHWPLAGEGQEDRYLIYGNLFYQNPHEALFQGEGNLALYNNLFINDHQNAVHIQPHNDVPRRIAIFFNTVLTPFSGITIRLPNDERRTRATAYPHIVSANLLFAGQPIRAAQAEGNITAAFAQAARYLRRPQAAPGDLDLHPTQRFTARYSPALATRFPNANRDFNGNPRQANEVGAYTYPANTNDWHPQLTRKPLDCCSR